VRPAGDDPVEAAVWENADDDLGRVSDADVRSIGERHVHADLELLRVVEPRDLRRARVIAGEHHLGARLGELAQDDAAHR
jgi:hypothetical protein